MSPSKRFLFSFVVAISCGISNPIMGQTLRELARQRARETPVVPIHVPAPPTEYAPTPLEQLTKEAVAVVRARLTRPESYLGPIEDRVLTDYLIIEPIVIAGDLSVPAAPVPRTGTPLTLTVLGGEVVIEGVPVRTVDTDREAIKDGAQYVIFLRPSRVPGPGRYEIYHDGIFEVSQDQVKPLLKKPEFAFEGPISTRLDDLVTRIQKGMQVR